MILWAFWATFLGLPVVVAWAHLFVTVETWWYTQTFRATFLAEEHAWLVVLCFATSPYAFSTALCSFWHKPLDICSK